MPSATTETTNQDSVLDFRAPSILL